MTITPLVQTRVLKAHIQAALKILDNDAFSAFSEERKRELAIMFATDIVSATDSMTRYCVIVPEATGSVYLYGPYATYSAAEKAAGSGELGTRVEESRGYILPMIPAPKLKRVRKK